MTMLLNHEGKGTLVENLEPTEEQETICQDWIEDCNHHHGRLLTGKFAHWCPDFDYLAIDETVDEFQYCQCEWEN